MAGRGIPPPGGHGRGRGIPGVFGRGLSLPPVGRSSSLPIPIGQLSTEEQQIASLTLSSPPGKNDKLSSGLTFPEDGTAQKPDSSFKRSGFPFDEGATRGRGMGRGRGMNISFRFADPSSVDQNVEHPPQLPKVPGPPEELSASSEELWLPAAPSRSPSPPFVLPGEQSSPDSQGSSPPKPISSRSKTEFNETKDDSSKSDAPTSLIIRRSDKGTKAQFRSFIRLKVQPGKGFYEYHVSFDPPIESTQFRKTALRYHVQTLGMIRMFDGTTLYLPVELKEKTVVLTGDHPADPDVKVRAVIRFIKKKKEEDCVQLYNILLNRVMEILGVVQMKRNLYDIRTVHLITQHKLEIWPGFVRSVEKHEGGLMLNLDISHKVLRKETVLDILRQIRNSGQSNWKKSFEEQVMGQIVLTRYNNLSYRIDDILWDLNPSSLFRRKGKDVKFIDFYKERHKISINEMDQPMLLSKIKPRKNDQNNEVETVCLIPELCSMTGLTSEPTTNFQIMKDDAQFTRITPQQWVVKIQAWLRQVDANGEAKRVLTDWGLSLDVEPLHVERRIATGPSITRGKLL